MRFPFRPAWATGHVHQPRRCRRGPWCRGVAAVEFALTAPVLILLMAGMYDLSSGWITWRRLATAAFSIGQIATIIAVQPDSTSLLTYNDAWRASTAIYAAMPQTLVAGASYGVTLSEVVFSTDSSCPANTYCVAKVSWSAGLVGPDATRRPCTRLNSVPDTAPSSLTTLPAAMFQSAPSLVVDVNYTFTPLFLQTLVGTIPMRFVQYFPSRSGTTNQFITYVNPNDPAAQCPG